MTEKEINNLIQGYKRDFFAKTGRTIKVQLATKWQAACEIPLGYNPEDVVDLMCEYTGYSKKVLFSQNRHAPYVEMRSMIAFVLWSNGTSLKKIANIIKKNHHTSVIYLLKQLELKLNNEPFTASFFIELINYVKEAEALGRDITTERMLENQQ